MPCESLFRVVFPERPGALMKFLDAVSPRWNITLFHYRRQVSMDGWVGGWDGWMDGWVDRWI